MSTGEETLLTSNAVKEGAFSSPGGGGMTFGENFSPDGRINDSDENEEQFRRASDSMFKEGNDFMSNADNAWIQPAGNNHNSNNPFLPDIGNTRKPDSGFISPACNSSNKSSDEDRKEDEEFLESQEVSKLLGGRPMEELLSRDTPTPPVDETGSSLEEILAAARDNPDSVGEVDDDDSDESSTDDPKPLPLKDSNSNQSANQNVSDSDENDEGDFTFVKEGSQVKNLLADELEDASKPELSNGHHQDNEDEGEGPSSVIIESQEAPNPDSASFILKTTSSEAPELPSPQEPIVEVIMEEGVGKASPIFEDVEEEDRHSLPSPQCNKTGKESSELECGGEVESSLISFQCKDDDANFVLKTPNVTSEEINLQPGAEESDCEPQFLDHAKEDRGEEVEEEKNDVAPAHPQEIEEIIEEVIEAQNVVSVGAHSLPPLVHKESEDKPNAEGEELEDDEENKDHQEDKTGIYSDDDECVDTKKDIVSDDVVAGAPVSPDPLLLVEDVITDGKAETTHDEHPKPADVQERPKVDNELIQLSDQEDEEIKEDAKLQEVVEQPIIEAESKVEVTASVEEVMGDNIKIESPVGEENEAKDEEVVVQKESIPLLEASKVVESLPEANKVVESLPEAGKAVESLPEADKAVESLPEADKAVESLPEADKAVESLPEALESIEKITENVVVSSSPKINEKVAASAPTSKGGSPKKEAKSIPKKSTPSTSKSASSSPKKTLSGSTAPNSAKSTLNRRPASATKTTSSVTKTTPKAGATTTASKPGSASRITATKPSGGAATSKTMTSRPSTAKSTTNSTLTKKPLSTSTSSRTTSATSSTLRSSHPSSEIKSRESLSKVSSKRSAPASEIKSRESLSKVSSKPASRVGSATKPSAAVSQVRSNGTSAAIASTTRKPMSSRTTTTSSTLSKRTTPSSATTTKSAGVTAARSSTTSSRITTSSSTTRAAGSTLTKRPTNVSARVSTGLSRPKSSSSSSVKAATKPTENGASPKASPVNGNDVTPPKEAVP